MLREETDFMNDAIGIDPMDCGCTDCIVGNSIPLGDSSGIAELLTVHFEEGRKIVFRCGGAFVAYRAKDGEYKHAHIYEDGVVDYKVISPEPGYFDYSMDEGTVISDNSTPLEESYGSTRVEDTALMEKLVEKKFREGEIIVNRTEDTLIVYRTKYSGYGHIMIDAEDDEPLISVIID